MRLLITGGSGFIGSALVRRAIAAGHEVLNFDKLTYAATPESLADVERASLYKFTQADICDRSAVSSALSAFSPDAVLNLAAESHVDRSIDSSDAFIQTNINGTHVLLEACRAWLGGQSFHRNFKFIQVSTDEVFGSIDRGAFSETSPYRPNSPYSASKASADMLVRAWTETYGFPGVITNCSNNYGPWQFPEKFIPTIIMKAIIGEAIPVYGDGQQVRDWLFVDDHADALLKVASGGRTGESYCIGGGATVANLDLAKSVCALVDEKRSDGAATCTADLLEFVQDRPGHDRRYAIDHSKISQELGWSPAHDFGAGLAQTVDWYLANQNWLFHLSEKGLAGHRLGKLTKQGVEE